MGYRPGVGIELLAPGDESNDDIGRMTVEVLPAPVVDRGRPRIGVPRRELDITERDSRIEGSHYKSCTKHVGVDDA
jgi:hypothetical protein